jgi:hypothetical protein
MPKKLRPAVDLMAFKCRTLKVNIIQRDIYFFKTEYPGKRKLLVHSSGRQPVKKRGGGHYQMHPASINAKVSDKTSFH